MTAIHDALSLDHPAYNTAPRKGWGGYTCRVTLLSLIGADAGRRLLRKLMPTVRKEQFLEIGQGHIKLALLHNAAWSTTVNQACMATFGRPYEFHDYKVSGVARDEFSDEDKNALRDHAYKKGQHHQLAIFHLMAAGHGHQKALQICRENGL